MGATHFSGPVVSKNGFVTDFAIAGSSTINFSTAADENRFLITANAIFTATLPSNAEIGDTFGIRVGVAVSGGSGIFQAPVGKSFVGTLVGMTVAGTGGISEALGGSDRVITMNGTTTGGLVGTTIEATYIGNNVWMVDAKLIGSGTMVSPVS